jgi:hypothetical protein
MNRLKPDVKKLLSSTAHQKGVTGVVLFQAIIVLFQAVFFHQCHLRRHRSNVGGNAVVRLYSNPALTSNGILSSSHSYLSFTGFNFSTAKRKMPGMLFMTV